jgi:hypothetical protein
MYGDSERSEDIVVEGKKATKVDGGIPKFKQRNQLTYPSHSLRVLALINGRYEGHVQ